MEETNYHRVSSAPSSSRPEAVISGVEGKPLAPPAEIPTPPATVELIDSTTIGPSRRTFIQKMELFQKGTFNRSNKLWRMVVRPLIF